MQDAERMRVAAVFIMCRTYFTEVIVVNPDIRHVDTFCGFSKADHADAAVTFVEHVAGGDDISECLCFIFQRAGPAELYGKSTFPTAIEIVVIISRTTAAESGAFTAYHAAVIGVAERNIGIAAEVDLAVLQCTAFAVIGGKV